MEITFSYQQINFKLSDEKALASFFVDMLHEEKSEAGDIHFVFCDDDYLHFINQEYLNHDTLTDIITFPYDYDPIHCDILISIDRIGENAREYQESFERELMRVMLHGLLHMVGYDDKTEQEKRIMRSREDFWLSQAEKRADLRTTS